jgi:hypothetical protein
VEDDAAELADEDEVQDVETAAGLEPLVLLMAEHLDAASGCRRCRWPSTSTPIEVSLPR